MYGGVFGSGYDQIFPNTGNPPPWSSISLLFSSFVRSFLGGLVDAVAGGGGLIALPAYLIAGVPAHLALGTNKLSSAMGTVVSAFRLWRAGFLNIRKSLPAIVCSLLGSAAGAHLALLVPERVFELILVGLLPIAAFLCFQSGR